MTGDISLRKILFSIMATFILLFIVACGASDTEGNDNQESNKKDYTINFGATPWSSTVPPTTVAGLILEDMGYDVEVTDADVSTIYIGLSRGDIDVFMDSWFPTHEVQLERYSDDVEATAISYEGARSGLVVPTYMEEINSIEDIIGNEDIFNNEIYGVEEGGNAAGIIDSLIEGYELDMKQVNSSEGGMLAQAQRMIEQEKPVVFYAWRPHTMFRKLDIKLIEDPKGFFSIPYIQVMTNKELKDNAPEAYEFLSNWSMDIDDLEAMNVEIEIEERDAKEVAREWIDNNQEKVNEMIGNVE